MKTPKWASAVCGAALLYLSYASMLVLVSEQYTLWLEVYMTGTYAPHEVSVGYFAPSVVCVVFVCALWLLGCVRTHSLYDAAPAFALCVVWLVTSSYDIDKPFSQYAFRTFLGGGATAFAFTGFSVIYGTVLWIRRRQKPVASMKNITTLLIYVAVMYTLDNLRPMFALSAYPGFDFTTARIYRYFTRLIYPMVVGGLGVPLFASKAVRGRRVGIALLTTAALCTIYNVFPYPPSISFAIAKFTFLLRGLHARLWPYTTGVLLAMGVSALISAAKSARAPD